VSGKDVKKLVGRDGSNRRHQDFQSVMFPDRKCAEVANVLTSHTVRALPTSSGVGSSREKWAIWTAEAKGLSG